MTLLTLQDMEYNQVASRPPGSETDGTHIITEFQFTHDGLGNSFNVGPSGSDSFSNAFSSPTTTTVTIGGGTVTGIDVIVNGSGSSFEMASGFDQVTLYDVIDANEGGDGTALDGSNFDGDTTFTRAGASWEFSAVPALAIITVGVGINKLVEKWRQGKKGPK